MKFEGTSVQPWKMVAASKKYSNSKYCDRLKWVTRWWNLHSNWGRIDHQSQKCRHHLKLVAFDLRVGSMKREIPLLMGLSIGNYTITLSLKKQNVTSSKYLFGTWVFFAVFLQNGQWNANVVQLRFKNSVWKSFDMFLPYCYSMPLGAV